MAKNYLREPKIRGKKRYFKNTLAHFEKLVKNPQTDASFGVGYDEGYSECFFEWQAPITTKYQKIVLKTLLAGSAKRVELFGKPQLLWVNLDNILDSSLYGYGSVAELAAMIASHTPKNAGGDGFVLTPIEPSELPQSLQMVVKDFDLSHGILAHGVWADEPEADGWVYLQVQADEIDSGRKWLISHLTQN